MLFRSSRAYNGILAHARDSRRSARHTYEDLFTRWPSRTRNGWRRYIECAWGGEQVLSKQDNELITRTGRRTPMGEMMRRYWMPALLSEEIPSPDCPPVQVRILGEDLVAFRDS